MKYSRNVFGQVVSLGVGTPAVVGFADGTTMTTSIVEEIVAADATSVTFATKNSVYTVQDFQCIGVERSVSSSYYAPKIGESYTFTNKSDAVIGIGANDDIVKACDTVLDGEQYSSFPDKEEMPLEGLRLKTSYRGSISLRQTFYKSWVPHQRPQVLL